MWYFPPIIWVVIMMFPGSNKTGIFKFIKKLFGPIQREAEDE
jgi:hypothetical protein